AHRQTRPGDKADKGASPEPRRFPCPDADLQAQPSPALGWWLPTHARMSPLPHTFPTDALRRAWPAARPKRTRSEGLVAADAEWNRNSGRARPWVGDQFVPQA